jgi:outer membrane receptor protein involved in Fe transport
MFKKKTISNAVATAITAGVAAGYSGASLAQLEEVIVTATKRAENMQDVPVSVRALTGDALKEQNIQTFDEYIEYLPNVVNAGNGPGQKEIYIRGSASAQTSVTVAPAQGSAPGVALYLDDTPVSFGSRNLDVYAADLERIEVLAGPQGTLFGASSQSGNIRLITNKPELGEFSASVDLGFSTTSGGDDSNNVEAMVNLPLTDRLSLRLVGYSDSQGGWIDNVSSIYTPNHTVVDRNAIGYGPQFKNYPNTVTRSANNSALAKEDWNEAKYSGYRAGLKLEVNDDWSVMVQHMSQELDVDGTFLVDPSMGDDKSSKFTPESNNDDFELTTWTIEGRIANLDVIYTGGYLDREVDSLIDYTHYNNGGGYITYYLCSGLYSSAPGDGKNTCFDPTKQYAEHTTNERKTHEFRISSDPDNRLRVLAGVYIADVDTEHLGEFQYFSTNDAFSEFSALYYGDNGLPYVVGNITVPSEGTNAGPNPRSPLTTFFNDFTRTEEETAFFGEIAFDVSDNLTASLSARRYELESKLQGASNFSFGCRYNAGAARNPCNSHVYSNDVTARGQALSGWATSGDDSIIINAQNPAGDRDMFRGGGSNAATLQALKDGRLDVSDLNGDGAVEEEDTIVKFALSWNVNDDIMLYAAYSEGYRPATMNRNMGQLAAKQAGVFEGYVVPAYAKTDTLENMEIGIKSELLNNTLRFNMTYYQTETEDLQVSRFDPSNVAFLFFMENVGDADTEGVDLDFMWMPSSQLTISGAMSFLDTELTRVNPQLAGVAVPVGSELPFSSDFSAALRMRYDFEMAGGDGYISAAMTHRGGSVTGLMGTAELFEDTQQLTYGTASGVGMSMEGGTYGSVAISDGELPANARYRNPSATTFNASMGYSRDNWLAEVYVNNITSEEGQIMQIAGKFTPEQTVMRPRTIGMRVSYNF